MKEKACKIKDNAGFNLFTHLIQQRNGLLFLIQKTPFLINEYRSNMQTIAVYLRWQSSIWPGINLSEQKNVTEWKYILRAKQFFFYFSFSVFQLVFLWVTPIFAVCQPCAICVLYKNMLSGILKHFFCIYACGSTEIQKRVTGNSRGGMRCSRL